MVSSVPPVPQGEREQYGGSYGGLKQRAHDFHAWQDKVSGLVANETAEGFDSPATLHHACLV